jgi:hypothetical protein
LPIIADQVSTMVDDCTKEAVEILAAGYFNRQGVADALDAVC